MSVNKLILVGNAGKAPELVTFPSGGQIAKISLATSRKWKDKQTGQPRQSTQWHTLIFRNGAVKVAMECFKKGDKLYIEGVLEYRKWVDDNQVSHMAAEISVLEFDMLSPKPQVGSFQQQAPAQQSGGFQQQTPAQQGGGFQQQAPAQQGGFSPQKTPAQQGGFSPQQAPAQQGSLSQ